MVMGLAGSGNQGRTVCDGTEVNFCRYRKHWTENIGQARSLIKTILRQFDKHLKLMDGINVKLSLDFVYYNIKGVLCNCQIVWMTYLEYCMTKGVYIENMSTSGEIPV